MGGVLGRHKQFLKPHLSLSVTDSAKRCHQECHSRQCKQSLFDSHLDEGVGVGSDDWLGSLGDVRDGQFIRLSQKWFQGGELFFRAELGYVADPIPIGADLEKNGMLDSATQMDCRSQSICHHDEIGEDAGAAKEHVSLTSDNLYRTK